MTTTATARGRVRRDRKGAATNGLIAARPPALVLALPAMIADPAIMAPTQQELAVRSLVPQVVRRLARLVFPVVPVVLVAQADLARAAMMTATAPALPVVVSGLRPKTTRRLDWLAEGF